MVKKAPKKIIMAGLVPVFCFIACCGCGRKSAAINEKDLLAIRSSFARLQKAVEDSDYKTIWRLTAKKGMDKFEGDFEKFQDYYKEEMPYRWLSELKIRKLTRISDNTVILLFNQPLESAYMSFEDGYWKFNGGIYKDLVRTLRDLAQIDKGIRGYYTEHRALPAALDEIAPNFIKELPQDRFQPDKKPYVYSKSGTSWKVYSFGPDQDDDSGLIECNVEKDTIDNGDIVSKGSTSEQSGKEPLRPDKRRTRKLMKKWQK